MNSDDVPGDGPTKDRDATPTSSPSGRADGQRSPGDVTQILSAIERGDGQAAEQLLPLVYEELRKLAAAKMSNEKPGQTLQATALVHEAYVRLVDVDKAQNWDSRGHFFAAAAEAMRRILVNRARDKGRHKHGGDHHRLDFDGLEIAVDDPGHEVLVLDDVLDSLAAEDPESARLLQLRFFGGLTMEQAASTLGMSRRTAFRCWTFARAWLYEQMDPDTKIG